MSTILNLSKNISRQELPRVSRNIFGGGETFLEAADQHFDTLLRNNANKRSESTNYKHSFLCEKAPARAATEG